MSYETHHNPKDPRTKELQRDQCLAWAICLHLDGKQSEPYGQRIVAETVRFIRSASMTEGCEVYPQRPLTDFLSGLAEDPGRLEMYRTAEGFQQLVDEHRLPDDLQRILRDNDLRAAQEVIREEIEEDIGGENVPPVLFFVIMHQ